MSARFKARDLEITHSSLRQQQSPDTVDLPAGPSGPASDPHSVYLPAQQAVAPRVSLLGSILSGNLHSDIAVGVAHNSIAFHPFV
jgi:hypothetical protein